MNEKPNYLTVRPLLSFTANIEYCAIENISSLPFDEAASKVVKVLKDILPAVSALEWEQIVSNIRKSGKGLLGSGYGFTLLHAFCELGNYLSVSLLLEKGADIDAKENNHSYTPLILATRAGHIAIVKLLPVKGADIEAKCDGDCTSLIHAASKGHEAIVALLLERGAEIEAKDKDNCTALSYSTCSGYDAVVELLMARGANIEVRDKGGFTPLMCASNNGLKGVVELLLPKSEIEARSKDGLTALHLASREGHADAVLLLVGVANIEAKDKVEYTSLMLASWKGHLDVVIILLNAGANPEAQCVVRRYLVGSGLKAIHLASGKQAEEIKIALMAARESQRRSSRRSGGVFRKRGVQGQPSS
jgi:ankyrin repeat protein